MNQNESKTSYYSSLTGFRRAIPIILFAAGAFIALCYFTAEAGWLGGVIASVMLGLFSYGAYAVPVLLLLHGVFYPSDVVKKRTLSRFIFSLVAVLCISVLSYAIYHVSSEPSPGFMPSEYYAMGTNGKGGGLIGSILAFGIIKILGSVGLIIITAAVFAIYVAYFFTDGHGVIGKVSLAILSFFANIGAFIERGVKCAFGKIKNARSEKDKRISVAKSRDLSEDDFFMVDNGMQNFEVPELGIKETRSAESIEESPMLHDKVRFKSTVEPSDEAEKESLRDIHITDVQINAPKNAPKKEEKPQRRKIFHSDFGLDEVVSYEEPTRSDDIIYEESDPAPIFTNDDSADSVFARPFDPFDISANEKLAAKTSSKGRMPGASMKKEQPRFTEDISSITPEDVERARKQAEFDMKKRSLTESYAKPATEQKKPTVTEINKTPIDESTLPYLPNAEYLENNESEPIGSADNTSSLNVDFPESAAQKEDTESYENVMSRTVPCAEKTDYERVARFSDLITEYSTSAKEDEPAREEAPVIQEYKAPDADEKLFSTNESAPVEDLPTEEFSDLPEESFTITLEREMLTPEPKEVPSDEEGESEFEPNILEAPVFEDITEPSEEYVPSKDELADGALEDEADEPDIIPPEERNPKIDEYRSMFPILEEESNEAEPSEAEESYENEENGAGLVFEHAPVPEPEEIAAEERDSDAYDSAEPPFDVDDTFKEEIYDEPEKEEPTKPKKPDYSNYKFPPIDILAPEDDDESDDIQSEIEDNANKLIATLESFRVKASIKGVDRGPRITRYEIVPATGVKVSSIMSLQNDIALNLAAEGIRMEAPIPGKSAIGFELPNRKPSTVRLRSLLETEEFISSKSKTMVCIGKDVAGCPVFGDISKMPHVLIAGATGMGKSVCINSIMISMLYKARPDEVKFIMIDPKKVEFTMYNGIPHLLIPVVTDPKQAAGALMWAVEQMEKRYELIEKMRVRNIEMYNDKIAKDPSLGEPMSKIVVVIDELNDLMLQVRDPVEGLIMSIAQKARAAGIHLIIGTQRPSVDVITGVIKANIPSRISCKVMSNTDSRTILDQKGAEDLLDKGDMLFFPAGKPKPARVQGAFVSDGEVEEIMEFLKSQGGDENYDSDVMEEITRNAQKCNKKSSDDYDGDDEDGEDNMGFLNDQKFLDAVNVAVTTGKISTSLLQRKLSIGYGKAAKYVDTMEDMGIVSEANGQKARDVLITKDEWHEKLARLSLDD